MSNQETINPEQWQVEKFANIFKALSNPNRLRILLELTHCSVNGGGFSASVAMDEVENCQQEFAKKLGLAPSTISHHFKELRQAGLLKIRREGKKLVVWVDAQAINSIKDLF
jgi:ArsR family transcriptional regulator